ncbi:MAG: hypothetical protein NC324_07270 [Bacteroides sp.]|nr:hypothetical protein [Bacteroides sp.]
MESEIFKTKRQLERGKRDLAIYNEYQELIKIAGASKMAIIAHLMKKYNLYGTSTVYTIINRVRDKKISARNR